ncbi:hypothetical protein Tco_0057387 [Tanacetum coccineum]
MKHTTATTFINDTIELGSIEEADKSFSLMAGPQKNSQNTQVKPDEKEELFIMKIQVKHEVTEAIVDTGSQKNLISATLVRKLGLPTTQHPSPYLLGWISNNMKTQVKEKCEFCFAIMSQYVDEVICEVVSLDIFQVSAVTLSCFHEIDKLEQVIENYRSLFENKIGLPPNRVIEHEIQLVANLTLPNIGMYRNSLLENAEIKC